MGTWSKQNSLHRVKEKTNDNDKSGLTMKSLDPRLFCSSRSSRYRARVEQLSREVLRLCLLLHPCKVAISSEVYCGLGCGWALSSTEYETLSSSINLTLYRS